jgi:hypothetical protein
MTFLKETSQGDVATLTGPHVRQATATGTFAYIRVNDGWITPSRTGNTVMCTERSLSGSSVRGGDVSNATSVNAADETRAADIAAEHDIAAEYH